MMERGNSEGNEKLKPADESGIVAKPETGLGETDNEVLEEQSEALASRPEEVSGRRDAPVPEQPDLPSSVYEEADKLISSLLSGGNDPGDPGRTSEANKPREESAGPVIRPAVFEEFTPEPGASQTTIGGLDLLLDVPLSVTVELGKARCYVRDILNLTVGSVIELEKLAGDPVDVLVNGKLIAKGEVVVLDENFGVRIQEIVSGTAKPRKERSR
ncbi:MAG: flagellar motor switch protein FliN [Firmicutes bacterium]|nr:flagellar motor switch protein FliN [Candidatus Fermentithermobacillaceae bacterium]